MNKTQIKDDNELIEGVHKMHAEIKEAAKTNTIANTHPLIRASLTVKNILHNGVGVDLESLAEQLGDQRESILDGKTGNLESIMISQVQALQALFHFAAERITHAEMLSQMQAYIDLAVKANNACRKTILAINETKNPKKATFIKQQNNAVNQQINHSKSFKKKKSKKELNCKNDLLSLPEQAHETLDFRGEAQASRIDPALETVESHKRVKNRRGEKYKQNERF